uniref:Bromo domain-containing protein n=2 Tax=Parascaris univalens TaxID=6257 RepID=A0A915AS00_PARUN
MHQSHRAAVRSVFSGLIEDGTMPVADGVIWQKRRGHCGGAKFHIDFTDETFPTEGEMKKREKEYAEHKWTCRHLSAKGEKTSMRIALKKEREALLDLRKRVPDDMLAEICKTIHHSFANEKTLLEDIRSRLKKSFFVGETVTFTHHERGYEGRIRACCCGNDLSSSDKENERTYAIEITGSNDCKIVKDVLAISIRRKLSLSDDELRCLIALLAFKEKDSNKPWIVDDEFREQFNVPNKIHSIFSCVSHRSTQPSPNNSKEQQVVKMRQSSEVVPHSAITNKGRKQPLKSATKSGGWKYTMKDKEGTGRIKKREEGKMCKKGTNVGELLQKKKKSVASKVQQRDLAEYLVTASSCKSPVTRITRSMIEERKLEATIAKLVKELIAQDTKAFHSACAVAAKSLSLSLIEAIPNDILRYAVMKQYDANQDAEAMKRMSVEEKKEYKEMKLRERKEEHSEMEKKLQALLNKKLEDTLIRHKLPIPELKRMELGAEDRRMHFVSCLVVSEFVNTFKDTLLLHCVPSAERILDALYKGREGFFEVIGHIVVAFLKLLLEDTSGKMYGVCGVRLRMVPVTLSTASGLVHLVLMSYKSLWEAERRAAGNDDAVAANSERDVVTPVSSSGEQSQIQRTVLVDKLKRLEFFELSASEQLEALQFLQERVLETDTLDTYICNMELPGIAKLNVIKKTKEAEIASLEAELDEVPMSHLAAKSPSKMTRKESIDWAKIEKHRQEVIRKIEQRREDISVIVRRIREMGAKHNVFHIKPLGSDRFHRRYWFFGQSPNIGIFVEEIRPLDSSSVVLKVDSKQSPRKDSLTSDVMDTSESTQRSKNGRVSHGAPSAIETPKEASMTLDAFVNHEPTFLDDIGESEWFQITDEAVLGKLIAALSEKGYRESYLRSNLIHQMDQIKSSMRRLRVGQMPLKGMLRREDDDRVHISDERSLLREEISNLESRLRRRHFTTTEGHEAFVAKLQSADNVQLLSEMILELEDSCHDRLVKEKMDGSTNAVLNRDEWRTFVKNGETISILSVLLCILKKRIDWDQSANNKSRESRNEKKIKSMRERECRYTVLAKDRRASTDGNSSPSLKQELQEIFAKVEEDNRIYNSLLAVPAVRGHTRRSTAISLENIREVLYSYPSVEDLKKDLHVFIDGALMYFKGNERKLSLLQKLKTDLRL